MTKKKQQQTLIDLRGAHAKHIGQVNRSLTKAGLPLRVKSIQYELTEEAGATKTKTLSAPNCCFIDGHFVCGPQCP